MCFYKPSSSTPQHQKVECGENFDLLAFSQWTAWKAWVFIFCHSAIKKRMILFCNWQNTNHIAWQDRDDDENEPGGKSLFNVLPGSVDDPKTLPAVSETLKNIFIVINIPIIITIMKIILTWSRSTLHSMKSCSVSLACFHIICKQYQSSSSSSPLSYDIHYQCRWYKCKGSVVFLLILYLSSSSSQSQENLMDMVLRWGRDLIGVKGDAKFHRGDVRRNIVHLGNDWLSPLSIINSSIYQFFHHHLWCFTPTLKL